MFIIAIFSSLFCRRIKGSNLYQHSPVQVHSDCPPVTKSSGSSDSTAAPQVSG